MFLRSGTISDPDNIYGHGIHSRLRSHKQYSKVKIKQELIAESDFKENDSSGSRKRSRRSYRRNPYFLESNIRWCNEATKKNFLRNQKPIIVLKDFHEEIDELECMHNVQISHLFTHSKAKEKPTLQLQDPRLLPRPLKQAVSNVKQPMCQMSVENAQLMHPFERDLLNANSRMSSINFTQKTVKREPNDAPVAEIDIDSTVRRLLHGRKGCDQFEVDPENFLFKNLLADCAEGPNDERQTVANSSELPENNAVVTSSRNEKRSPLPGCSSWMTTIGPNRNHVVSAESSQTLLGAPFIQNRGILHNGNTPEPEEPADIDEYRNLVRAKLSKNDEDNASYDDDDVESLFGAYHNDVPILSAENSPDHLPLLTSGPSLNGDVGNEVFVHANVRNDKMWCPNSEVPNPHLMPTSNNQSINSAINIDFAQNLVKNILEQCNKKNVDSYTDITPIDIFDKPCALYLEDKCLEGLFCMSSHSLPQARAVRENIQKASLSTVNEAFTLLMRYSKLRSEFFQIFCEYYGEKKERAQLLQMAKYCKIPKYNLLRSLKDVVEGFVATGMEYHIAMDFILRNCRNDLPATDLVYVLRVILDKRNRHVGKHCNQFMDLFVSNDYSFIIEIINRVLGLTIEMELISLLAFAMTVLSKCTVTTLRSLDPAAVLKFIVMCQTYDIFNLNKIQQRLRQCGHVIPQPMLSNGLSHQTNGSGLNYA